MKFAEKHPRTRQKGHATIMSLEKFEQATLEEAKKVILGESRWFAFDDDGKMRVLDAGNSPEQLAPSATWREKKLAVIQSPDIYRKKLEELKKNGPEFSPLQREYADARIAAEAEQMVLGAKQSIANITDEEAAEIRKRSEAMQRGSDEESRKLWEELYDYMMHLEGQEGRLIEDGKGLTEEEEKKLAALRYEGGELEDSLRNLEKHHRERHEKEVDALVRMLDYAEVAEQYDTKYAELEALIKEADVFPESYFIDVTNETREQPDYDQASDLRFRILILADRLEGAADIRADAQEQTDSIQAMVQPFGVKTPKMRQEQAETAHSDMRCNAFSPERRNIVQAVMGLLSAHNPAPTLAEAEERFNDQVSLTVHSDYTSDFFADLRDQGQHGKEMLYGFLREDSLEQNVGRIQGYIEQFEKVARGNMEGKLSEEELAAVTDFDTRWAERDWYDPHTLIKNAAEHALGVFGPGNEDYMRMHNQFPEAVNFIRSSRESAFLMNYRQEEKEIENPASFFASPWAHVMGGADIHVEPKLLEQAREKLRGNSRMMSV